MAQGFPGGYAPTGGESAHPLEFALCEFCGRELPARMMDTHKNRVHNVPLPRAPPRPPGAPDPSIPPWISDQGPGRGASYVPPGATPRFPPSAATALSATPHGPPAPSTPSTPSPKATGAPVAAPPPPGAAPPAEEHPLPPPPPDWVPPSEATPPASPEPSTTPGPERERSEGSSDVEVAPAEEAPVAETPPVLTEEGAVAPEGEPAPVPEADPEQVAGLVAEAGTEVPAPEPEAEDADREEPSSASAEADAEVDTSSTDDEPTGEGRATGPALPPGEVPPHEHEVPEHEHEMPEHQHELPEHQHELPEHQHDLTEHQHDLPEHQHDLPEHQHDLPEHEHELPEHQHDVSEHQHELPEHEHEVAEHEHELPAHDHEDYKGLLDTQGADLEAVKHVVHDLTGRLQDREEEIQRLRKAMDESEQVRAALAREVALARADREKMTQSLPVVLYDAEEKRVASVNLFASGHGEALEKLIGALIHSWQNEGKNVDVTGLPPNMAVKVRDDPQGRGFELFPSSVLFLRVTSKEREAMGALPPLVSQPERKEKRDGSSEKT